MVKYRTDPIYSDEFPDRNNVLWTDVVNLKNYQMIKLTVLEINSRFEQGVSIAPQSPKGYIEFRELRTKGFYLWFSSQGPKKRTGASGQPEKAPREFLMRYLSKEGEGKVSIWNAYKRPDGKFYHHMNKSGMILEKKDGKRIYHCNDVGEHATFDKLVFSIEII